MVFIIINYKRYTIWNICKEENSLTIHHRWQLKIHLGHTFTHSIQDLSESRSWMPQITKSVHKLSNSEEFLDQGINLNQVLHKDLERNQLTDLLQSLMQRTQDSKNKEERIRRHGNQVSRTCALH